MVILNKLDDLCLYIYEKLFEAVDAEDNHISLGNSKSCFDWLSYADLNAEGEFMEYVNLVNHYLAKHIPNLCKRYILEAEERTYYANWVQSVVESKPYCVIDRHLVTMDELDPTNYIKMIIQLPQSQRDDNGTFKVLARSNVHIAREEVLKGIMPNPSELLSVNRFQDQAIVTTYAAAEFIVNNTLSNCIQDTPHASENNPDSAAANYTLAISETLHKLKDVQHKNIDLLKQVSDLNEKLTSVSSQYRDAIRKHNDFTVLLGDLQAVTDKVKAFEVSSDQSSKSLCTKVVTGYNRLGKNVRRAAGLVVGSAALGGLYLLTRKSEE
jgi:hypothetical protein